MIQLLKQVACQVLLEKPLLTQRPRNQRHWTSNAFTKVMRLRAVWWNLFSSYGWCLWMPLKMIWSWGCVKRCKKDILLKTEGILSFQTYTKRYHSTEKLMNETCNLKPFIEFQGRNPLMTEESRIWCFGRFDLDRVLLQCDRPWLLLALEMDLYIYINGNKSILFSNCSPTTSTVG